MSRDATPPSRSGRWRQWWQRLPGHAMLDAAYRWQREQPTSSRDYVRHQTQPVRDWGLDQRLFWTVFGLLCWGLVMVYSASVALPDSPKYGSYAQWHFVLRHLLSLGVGTLAPFVVGPAQQHKDNLKDVDNQLLLDQLQGFHIHLEPNPHGQPDPILWQGYRPIGRKIS